MSWTPLLVALTLCVAQQIKADVPGLDCLDEDPGQACSISVTYESLGEIECNQIVPEAEQSSLKKPPTLKVTPTDSMRNGILIMHDPDAPVSRDPRFGFAHWIANVQVSLQGDVSVVSEQLVYIPPAPPRGSEPHRYQFFLFLMPRSGSIVIEGETSRRMNFCGIVKENSLGQPFASSQYRYMRE